MKYERWAFAAKISPGFSPVDKIMTPSLFINFIWKYVFFKELGRFLRFLMFFLWKH